MRIKLAQLPFLLVLVAVASFAADPPPMKEGYWSMHTVTTEQPTGKKTEAARTICRNHAYDDYVKEMGKQGAGNCKTLSENSAGGTTTAELQCDMGGMTVHSKTSVTVASDTAAHSETHNTYTPAMHGIAESTMVMDQKYLGACPAGVAAGDMMNADGKKISSWKH